MLHFFRKYKSGGTVEYFQISIGVKGRQPLEGRQTGIFPFTCKKLHENEEIWAGSSVDPSKSANCITPKLGKDLASLNY